MGIYFKQVTTDLAPDYHVKWPPDGKQVAFASKSTGENDDIWIKDIKKN
jgi:Tol biopolymer transport system component